MKKFFLMLCVVSPLFLLAQEITYEGTGTESEFKDTPYFSGMPNHKITEASDQEFADYRFYNGKDCTVIEGKKYFRSYTLKEGAKRSSELQISRNYSNSVKSIGGTVVFEGECSGSDCAENCGGRMMVGKVTKGGNELSPEYFSTWHPFSIASGFQSGSNTLGVMVGNNPTPGGGPTYSRLVVDAKFRAVGTAPALFFTDLTSGPKTGG